MYFVVWMVAAFLSRKESWLGGSEVWSEKDNAYFTCLQENVNECTQKSDYAQLQITAMCTVYTQHRQKDCFLGLRDKSIIKSFLHRITVTNIIVITTARKNISELKEMALPLQILSLPEEIQPAVLCLQLLNSFSIEHVSIFWKSDYQQVKNPHAVDGLPSQGCISHSKEWYWLFCIITCSPQIYNRGSRELQYYFKEMH